MAAVELCCWFIVVLCFAPSTATTNNFCAQIHDDDAPRDRCNHTAGNVWTVCAISQSQRAFSLIEFAQRLNLNSTPEEIMEPRRALRVEKRALPGPMHAANAWDEFMNSEKFPLPDKRGLFAVPTSFPPTPEALKLVEHFSQNHFDVIILCFTKNISVAQVQTLLNQHDFGENVVLVRRQDMSAALHCPSCATDTIVMKFLIAKLVLRPELVSHYAGLWFFDDDVALAPRFDANAYLSLVTAVGIDFSSPAVILNHHVPLSNRLDAHFLVTIPEIMVPHYSPRAWACIFNLIHDSTAFGIDTRSGYCLCDCRSGVILLQQPVMHNDRHSFTSVTRDNPSIGQAQINHLQVLWEKDHPCGDGERKEGLYVVASNTAGSGAQLSDLLDCPIAQIAPIRGDRWLDTDSGKIALHCVSTNDRIVS
jgi:hypothetical protein